MDQPSDNQGPSPAADGVRPLPSHAYHSALRNTILDAALAGPMITVLAFGGAYVNNFAKSLGATQTQIGWISAVGAVALAAQFGASYQIERSGTRRPLTLAAYLMARATWLPVLVWCLLPGLPPAARIGTLVLGVGIHQAWQTAAGCGWLAWLKDLVPRPERGAYLGRRSMWVQVTSIVAIFAVAQSLDRLSSRAGPQAYFWPFLIPVLLALVGLLFLRQVPEPPRIMEGDLPPRYQELLGAAFKDRDLRRMVAYQTLWTAAARLAGPFIQIHLRHGLGLSFTAITLFQQMARASNAVQQRFWGPIVDRYGNRPALVLSSSILAASGLLWLTVNRHNYFLLLPVIYLAQGAANAGIGLSNTNLVLRLAPSASPSVYLATFNAVAGLLSAAAPLLAGMLDDALAGERLAIGPLALAGIQVLFVLQFLLRLGAITVATQVREAGVPRFLRFLRRLARSSRRNPIALGLRTALVYSRVRVHWRRQRRRRR